MSHRHLRFTYPKQIFLVPISHRCFSVLVPSFSNSVKGTAPQPTQVVQEKLECHPESPFLEIRYVLFCQIRISRIHLLLFHLHCSHLNPATISFHLHCCNLSLGFYSSFPIIRSVNSLLNVMHLGDNATAFLFPKPYL